MKYYCECISVPLAEKLKEKGMPIEKEGENTWCPPYAACFDWLMEQGINMDLSTRSIFIVWDKEGNPLISKDRTWHEAANKAIEKALTLI